MAAIFTICPESGREIATGIEADTATLEKLPAFRGRVHCAHCLKDHEWSQGDMWLRESDGTLRPWTPPIGLRPTAEGPG